jgi:phenylacetate-CoA ligase
MPRMTNPRVDAAESSFPGFDPWLGAWSAETPDDPKAIAAWQRARAWAIAEHAAAHNPFYRSRLRLPTGRDAAAFRRLSLTRKDDVVADCEAHPPFGSRTVVPPERIRMIVQTSGTSGHGTEVYALDEADEEAIVHTEAVGFLWAGIRPGARVLLTLPIGVTAAGLWYHAALRFLGANVISAGPYPTARKVELLARYGAEVVVGTPSYIHRLAVACEDAGHDPAGLGVETLLVAGESYSEHWAREIERRWGAILYEQYGCTERAIAWTCPDGVMKPGGLGVLHFPPEAALCEVTDPVTGEHVGDGQEGELVVTPFGADASPLVRYATGDRVRWVAPGGCACARPLAGLVAGAVERFDDMMKIRGVNVWPAQFDAAVFGVEGVVDYRGTVAIDGRGVEALRIRIEAGDEAGDGIARRVEEAVEQATGLTARIERELPGTMAREVPEGFVKMKRWQDERKGR